MMQRQYAVGDHVMVVDAADETADQRMIGRCGIVTALDTSDCGSSAHDPLYRVRFSRKIASFWGEELSLWPLAEARARPSGSAHARGSRRTTRTHPDRDRTRSRKARAS